MKVIFCLLVAVSVSRSSRHGNSVRAFVPHASPSRTAYSSAIRETSEPASALLESLKELPNPFKALKAPEPTFGSVVNQDFDPSPEGIIQQAKRVIAADFGVAEPSLLDSANFQWIGPVVDQPLSKTEYLAAGRFFDLRSTFPDLDYRAHDFRIDDEDEATVRLTCRVTGTMRGELRLRNGVLAPNGKTMVCPPEAVTIKFNMSTGKVVKLCTGFGLDRLVGNTAGTTGVMAASTIAGEQVSDWAIYPPTTVLKRFFGRPVQQLGGSKAFLAPFPETVMIQLAKGILATNMASEDPTLLAESFTYSTPTIDPVKKREFLAKYAEKEFEGIEPTFSYFRVDPYDPERVWVDVQATATGYTGAPQAMSFTFDDEGFCTRITSGAVIDPTIGNGGGLGGTEGFKYATGQSSLPISSRPLPRILGRLRKRILQPITGIGVDEYRVAGQAQKPAAAQKPKPPTEKPPLMESLASLKGFKTQVKAFNVGQSSDTASSKPETAVNERVLRQEEAERRRATQEKSNMEARQAKLAVQQQAAQKRQEEAQAKKAAAEEVRSKKMEAQQATAARRKQEGRAKKAAASARKPQVKASRGSRTPEITTKKTETNPFAGLNLPNLVQKQSLMTKQDDQAARRRAAEGERKRLQEEKRQQTEAQARAQREQAEARRLALEKQKREKISRQKVAEAEKLKRAEERRLDQVKARKEQEEARRLAAKKRKQEQLERQQAAEFEKQRRAQMKLEQEETKRKQREAKLTERENRMAEQKSQVDKSKRSAKALDAVSKASPLSSISLFGLGGKVGDKPTASKPQSERAPVKKISSLTKESKIAEAAARNRRATAALNSLSQAAARATIPLFGGNQNEVTDKQPSAEVSVKRAPSGVPTLSKWRKNFDGSISGNITGSRNFGQGERITTSTISSGTIASGEVVQTKSGSKYFLS